MIISLVIAVGLLKVLVCLIKCGSYLSLIKSLSYKSLALNEFIFKLIFKLRSFKIKASFLYTNFLKRLLA
jgi:hypothetical protein